MTFEELKKLIREDVEKGNEPEVWLIINGAEYMIIGFDGKCSFQRCGARGTGSGEFYYKSLDELYETETVDGIVLKRDWNKITEIYSYDLDIYV
ncbi:MAG: hypothetical protein K2G32_04655 [Oscillospiraceae bacterium]|nr:hypothetical protein [Oscillospiraceae bacterium]